MFMLILDLFACCSLPVAASLPPLAHGENLARPEAENIGENRADHRLPFYTSGFK